MPPPAKTPAELLAASVQRMKATHEGVRQAAAQVIAERDAATRDQGQATIGQQPLPGA